MVQPGEYSDTLRALGRVLDRVSASDIEIQERADHWFVSWESGPATQYGSDQLETLRTCARLHRGMEGDVPQFNTSQILRVLGRTLDTSRATQFCIRQFPEGFQFSAGAGGTGFARLYPLDELRELASQHIGVRQTV